MVEEIELIITNLQLFQVITDDQIKESLSKDVKEKEENESE